jgi:hypothetical protein
MQVPIKKKVFEFGESLDAVSHSGAVMDAQRKKGVGVHSIVMCDQFGIAHPS